MDDDPPASVSPEDVEPEVATDATLDATPSTAPDKNPDNDNDDVTINSPVTINAAYAPEAELEAATSGEEGAVELSPTPAVLPSAVEDGVGATAVADANNPNRASTHADAGADNTGASGVAGVAAQQDLQAAPRP